MADFPERAVESQEDLPFKWLREGHYDMAILSFNSWILHKKLTSTDHVEERLGNFYRGLAEAYWHVHQPDCALDQIKRCIRENCHEFSEVIPICPKLF